jgi:hypothetical protein
VKAIKKFDRILNSFEHDEKIIRYIVSSGAFFFVIITFFAKLDFVESLKGFLMIVGGLVVIETFCAWVAEKIKSRRNQN